MRSRLKAGALPASRPRLDTRREVACGFAWQAHPPWLEGFPSGSLGTRGRQMARVPASPPPHTSASCPHLSRCLPAPSPPHWSHPQEGSSRCSLLGGPARTVFPHHWADSKQSQGTCLWLPRRQAPCWGPKASPASLAWGPHGLSSTAPLVSSPSTLGLPPPSPTLGLWRRLVGPPVQKADEVPVRGGAVWGQRTRPGGKPGSGNRGAPNWRLGDRKPSPHPASSPTTGTRPRKPRKGELGLFLFCSQPLPVSKLRAATGLTPPCPPPPPQRLPFWGEAGRCMS